MKVKRKIFACIASLLLLSGCQSGKVEDIITNPNQAEINSLMEVGDGHFAQANYEVALEKYEAVQALDASYVLAHIQSAHTHLKLDNVDQAKTNLTAAEKLLGTDKPAIYHEVYASYHLTNRDYPGALQSINQAIKLESNTSSVAIRGMVQYFLHNHAEAKTDLKQATGDKTDSEITTYYYLLAEIAIYEQDYTTANNYLTTVTELNAEDSRAYAMQAYVLLSQKEHLTETEKQTVEALLTQAQTKNETTTQAVTYNYLGLSAYLQNNHETAKTYYTKAIELDEKYAVFYNNRALVNYANGDNESAYKDLSKAIQLDTLEPEFYLGRGYVLMTMNQDNAALGDFSKAVALDATYLNRIPADMQENLPNKEEDN